MSEKMTLEKAIAVMAACAYKKDATGIVDAWEVIKDHLNAAKGEVDFDTTYHGVMIRKMAEMLSNNEWADLFTGDDAIAALQEQISRLVANISAAKGEAVAWRYRFYGLQGWSYATAGEGLVCGLPLICSQPLYAHPASPDVELCSRILAMNEMAQALFGVILDITSGDYYESNNVDIRSEPWSWLFNDASEFAGEWNEMIRSIKLSSMAAREGGE